MNSINRENYESFFLDYIEGNLDASVVTDLLVFLDQHPDLAIELKELGSSKDLPLNVSSFENLSPSDKESLKKPDLPIEREELNRLLIGRMENDLDVKELGKLEQWRKIFPAITAETASFEKARLKTGGEVFREKEVLKVPEKIDSTDPLYLLIAFLEGDLSASAEQEVKQRLVSDPFFADDYALLQSTRLHPPKIVFENKDLLRQQVQLKIIFPRFFFRYTVAAAASVVLLIWLITGSTSHPAHIASRITADSFDLEVFLISLEKKAMENLSTHNKSNVIVGYEVRIPENNPTDAIAENIQEVLPVPVVQRIDSRGAILFSMSGREPVPLADMKKIHEQSFFPATSQTITGESLTLLEYAKKQAKQRIWGNPVYPKDNFALALVQKKFDQRFGTEDAKLEIERVVRPDSRDIRIRFGKFHYSRSRNIRR